AGLRAPTALQSARLLSGTRTNHFPTRGNFAFSWSFGKLRMSGLGVGRGTRPCGRRVPRFDRLRPKPTKPTHPGPREGARVAKLKKLTHRAPRRAHVWDYEHCEL